MDIWAWTHTKKRELHEAGQDRLAEIMGDLPHWTCEDEHERAEALYNEGLALAREHDEKWVEVFLRHWHMQSQVLGLRNAHKLPEVIDLLNLSHQDETRDCPQRICAVQDLANCYGIKDGPAYFEERVAVAEETLAEINATWPCYCCISVEMIDAYLDVEDYATALEKVDLATRELAKVNDEPGQILMMKARALLGLGRADEALEALQSFSGAGYGLQVFRQAQQILCLVHIAREDWPQVEESLLSFDDAMSASVHFRHWVQIRYQLHQAGRFDVTGGFLREGRTMLRRLEEAGAAREALVVAGMLAQLAMSAGFWVVAEIALTAMHQQLPLLAKDLGASDEVAELERQLVAMKQALPALESSLTLEAFHALEFESEDEALHALIQAYARWPDEDDLVVRLAAMYEHVGAGDKALALLAESRDRLPESGAVERAYGRLLLNASGEEGFTAACPLDVAGLPPQVRVARLWNYVDLYRGSMPQRALECLEELLAIEPELPAAIYQRAVVLEQLERYDEAIASWQLLVDAFPEDSHLRWGLLVTATLAGHWELVREMAEVIGFRFEKGVALDEHDMGIVKVEFTDEHGDAQRCYAQRTGPATATIVDICQLGTPQRYGERLVFDPAPLNELSETDDEGRPCDLEGNYHFIYRNLKIVEAPGFSTFTLDGVHPGDERLEQLGAQLANLDVVLSRRSNDQYVLQLEPNAGNADASSEHTEELPGLFAYLLVPKDADLVAVDQCLEAFSGAQPHPLVWPELLEALGDAPRLERQADISKRYNL